MNIVLLAVETIKPPVLLPQANVIVYTDINMEYEVVSDMVSTTFLLSRHVNFFDTPRCRF